MAFHRRQRYSNSTFTEVTFVEDKVNEAGKFEHKLVNQCKKKMPDIALFDLGAQLRAGIQQEEVSSKILGPKVISADSVVRKYMKMRQPVSTESETEDSNV